MAGNVIGYARVSTRGQSLDSQVDALVAAGVVRVFQEYASAIVANVKALSEYRDRAIHLYNAQGLGAIIYPFLQQNVLNYRDFMLAKFNKDLADSMTWQLLPLGATAPADAVRFMRTDSNATMVTEVQQFIDALRGYMDEAEAAGSDVARVATIYDINMQSVKKLTSGT